MPSWHLVDADELAAAHKYTFYKPSRDLIAKVVPGENVKLIFAFESEDPEAPGAERMWVLVDAIEADGRFRGRLDNDPTWIKDLRHLDPVDFEARHIIDTDHDDPDNLVRKYIKRCFVTNRILEDGQRVGYLYREAPDEEGDSGWRFTAGDESEAYMEDAENSRYVSLGAVLSKDDSVIELLDLSAGAAFVRNDETGQWDSVERD